MSTIIINLSRSPYYEGTKALDGNTYKFRIRWNIYTAKWYLSTKGVSNDIEINGVALLVGKDLWGPYGERELGELRVIDNSGANEDPTYDGIGTRWTLEYTPLSDL